MLNLPQTEISSQLVASLPITKQEEAADLRICRPSSPLPTLKESNLRKQAMFLWQN